MKQSLFNWVNISPVLILEHRYLAENNAQSLPLKIKSQQYGWHQLIELCVDCFIRY